MPAFLERNTTNQLDIWLLRSVPEQEILTVNVKWALHSGNNGAMQSELEAQGPRHSIDLGLVLLLALLILLPLLIWYLIANWPATTTVEPSSPSIQEIDSEAGSSGREEARRIARQAGERNTRNYRRRLVDELARARLELEKALGQARLDPQPAARGQWRELIDERRARVRAASKRLAEFESLLAR